MPMGFAGRKPHRISGTDFTRIVTVALDETDAIQHEEKLAARMTVPMGHDPRRHKSAHCRHLAIDPAR
ncbi:hypothetical protein D3C71_1745830 [compost metagenome]